MSTKPVNSYSCYIRWTDCVERFISKRSPTVRRSAILLAEELNSSLRLFTSCSGLHLDCVFASPENSSSLRKPGETVTRSPCDPNQLSPPGRGASRRLPVVGTVSVVGLVANSSRHFGARHRTGALSEGSSLIILPAGWYFISFKLRALCLYFLIGYVNVHLQAI